MCREFLIKWCRVCLSKASLRTVATDLPGHEATYSNEAKKTQSCFQENFQKSWFSLIGQSFSPQNAIKAVTHQTQPFVKESGGKKKKKTWHTPLESLFMTLSQPPQHSSSFTASPGSCLNSEQCYVRNHIWQPVHKKYIWKCVMKAGIRQRITARRGKTFTHRENLMQWFSTSAALVS